MMDRRTLLGSGLGLATAALAPHVARAETLSSSSLAQLAAEKGVIFGSAVPAGRPGSGVGLQEPAYAALIADQCGALVCENEMKWYVVRREPVGFDFDGADQLVAFAEAHHMKMRGHTLLWHHPQWFPAWLNAYDFGPTPAAEAERLVTEHIGRMCERYPRVVSWDVINETVDPETGALRETSLSRAMGQQVLDLAFHTARQAAPHAQLVYNDYMSWEAGHETHRAGVLRLLEGFKARGVPIDALGVQSHIGSGNSDDSVGFDTAQEREWRAFLDEVTGMGLKLAITEFDVHDKNLPADPEVRDREVAALGRRYLDLMLDYPQTTTVMTWGLSDKYSWLQGNWPRADGIAKRPCPYDAEMRAKLLRQALADSFAAAAPRPPL